MQDINIAVCDDDKKIIGFLENQILYFGEIYGIKIEVEVFFDGKELIESISEGNIFDIIYLDIEMKIVNGVDTAKKIREFDNTVLLIYVTSYTSYALELFEVRPFRFIAKPIDEKVFRKYFDQALEEVTKNNFYFYFKYEKAYYKFLVSKIIYFESKKRIIYLYTTNGTYKFYGKLCDIEVFFANSRAVFLRIHQSFLINYNYIQKHSYGMIELTNGTILNISADRRNRITEQLCNIWGGDEFD